MQPIEIALCLLLVHGLLGAFDTFYNHEYVERLPSRPEAATELFLHGGRSFMFAITFAGLAWFEWRGAWGWVALAIIAIEYAITLADSVVEDRTRTLSAIERINHMLLGLNTGLYAAFVALQVVTVWAAQPSALVPTRYPYLSWLLTAYTVAVIAWALRDGIASQRLKRSGRAAVEARAA